MKIVSWNVNGIRSALKKDFCHWLAQTGADAVCLQETKISAADLAEHVPDFPGYASYWQAAERKGYSGVAILAKHLPLSVRHGLGRPEFDGEGRVLTLEFATCFLVSAYVPNSQAGFLRLPFRLAWDTAFQDYLGRLRAEKPVIAAGDFNVAHTDLDVGIADAGRFPGCSPEERASFDRLLESGFVDTFRRLHPQKRAYSWWSYAPFARAANQGLRFDYVLASKELGASLRAAATDPETPGSDHGPVSLELDLFLQGTAVRKPVSPLGQFGLGI